MKVPEAVSRSLAWLWSALLVTPIFAQRIIPADNLGAIFTQPQSTINLQVVVQDSQGNPLSSQSVLFIAPAAGPGGEFTPGRADTQTRVVTGNDGTASVPFYTNNQAGPFMVSAWLEGTAAVAHFAISTTTAPPPALAPSVWFQAVRDQLNLAVGTVDDGPLIYGPFLLEAGVVLGPARDLPDDLPVTLASQTALLWIDDDPHATYDHPVRWVLLDTSSVQPAVAASDHRWAPFVTSAGESAGYSLVAPYFALDPDTIPAAAAPTQSPAKAPPPVRRGDNSNTTTCVVLVYGPDESAFKNSLNKMKDVFSNTLNIPDANIWQNLTPGFISSNQEPSTPLDVHNLLVGVAGKGCKKLFFYYVGHGFDGGVALKKASNSKSAGDTDDYLFTKLATDLKNAAVPDVCVILQSCHSGSAIAALQGQGFNGQIITAADADHSAYHFPGPFGNCYWTNHLADSWKKLGQNATFSQIFGATLAYAESDYKDSNTNVLSDGYWILKGHSRISKIDAAGGRASVPAEILIEDLNNSSLNPVTFSVDTPADWRTQSNSLGGSVKIEFADNTIADNSSEFKLNGGENSVNITVTGLKEGHTTYTVTFKDYDGKTYVGTGTLRVGTGYTVTPSPATVHAGSSVTLKVMRGMELAATAGPVTVNIKAVDDASAGVASPSAASVTFQPGQTSVDLSVKGLKAGMARFTAGDGKASATFQVNVDNVSLNPGSLFMKPGDIQVVMLQREGSPAPSTGTPVVAVTGASDSVATATPSVFPFPTSTTSVPVAIHAFGVGSTTFTFTDAMEGFTLMLPVTVSTGSGTGMGVCPMAGNMALNIQVFSDLFNSASFVMMPSSATIPFTIGNGLLTLNGTIPQLPPGSGTFNTSTCSGSIMTVARSPIAGFSNVHVQYDVAFPGPSYTMVNMTIQVGTDKTLNNEAQPVVYKATGSVSK